MVVSPIEAVLPTSAAAVVLTEGTCAAETAALMAVLTALDVGRFSLLATTEVTTSLPAAAARVIEVGTVKVFPAPDMAKPVVAADKVKLFTLLTVKFPVDGLAFILLPKTVVSIVVTVDVVALRITG